MASIIINGCVKYDGATKKEILMGWMEKQQCHRARITLS